MQVWWVKIGDFWQITGYISKTVKDRHIVSIKESNRKSYALYRMVALHMTLSVPIHPKAPHFLHFAPPFVMGEPRDFKFCTRVGRSAMQSLSLSLVMSECFISGRGHDHVSNFYIRLRKFRHSKSSVYRWYTQFDRRRFVYDTWDNRSRLGRVMVECTCLLHIAPL